MFSRLAIPFIPNNPPRWPEVTEALKNIVEVYVKDSRKYERLGEWIERIGWEKFFRLTGIPFTEHHIDDFTGRDGNVQNDHAVQVVKEARHG